MGGRGGGGGGRGVGQDQKRGRKKKSCNGDSMKCFSHDNDHWKTPPYWLCEGVGGGGVWRGRVGR